MIDQNLINMIRQTVPAQLAQELVGVQPIDQKVVKDLFANAMATEDLVAQGYEPVDPQSKLLWVKK